MNVTCLGTSCMMPTKQRSHPAYFVRFQGEGLLLDCGEGTQRQFRIASIPPTKVTKIFISHWHGDHVLGIPGLLDTLQASHYQKTLQIYGPEGTKSQLKKLRSLFPSTQALVVEVIDVAEGVVYEDASLRILAYPAKHNIPCFGYRIEEKERRRIDTKKAEALGLTPGPMLGQLQKGKTITKEGKKIKPEDVTYIVPGKVVSYLTDSMKTKKASVLAQDADLFLCEATYDSSLADQAKERQHMTAQEAAEIAKAAKVKQLVLIHPSTRYGSTKPLLEDAKKVFKKVTCAKDLDTFSV